ncbi:MAG TPA: ribose-5-phosphate isomerase RpiA [Myxococcota bacterium]|nr:ribose-5-phosphate isomerase RpiA [Myxococcota bacterium]
MTAGERALEFIEAGQAVGLGTGRAASAFIERLAERVKGGLRLRGVPTSERSARLAQSLGIPLVSLADAGPLDLCVDGADEVDPQLDLIKGYGGALVREKIVAASARKLVILVGPEKLVQRLGARGRLPVEVVPFGLSLATRRLRDLGCEPQLRMDGAAAYLTDNGNHILDCGIRPLENPVRFESELRAIPGLVGSGLFLGMADVVIVEDGDRAEVRRRTTT